MKYKDNAANITCPGCHTSVPDISEPSDYQPYMGTIPGCWKVMLEVLTKEYEDYEYMKAHRITVDTYAVQHPGKPERQANQSVTVHLIALYCVYEKHMKHEEIPPLMQHILEKHKTFDWLTPPNPNGTMTVHDVAQATSAQEHVRLVTEWGKNVWDAWSEHHETIRDFIEHEQE